MKVLPNAKLWSIVHAMNRRASKMRRHHLSVRQENFCIEYAKSRNATDAYRRVYNAENSSPKTINDRSSELLAHPGIAARIQQLIDRAAEKAEFTVVDVLKNWVDIATADPNELMQLRRSCCRFCYGKNHHYQWTESEYAMKCAQAIQNGKKRPKKTGGFGFNATLDPFENCPMCAGEGEERAWLADTRKLKGKARLLYAGLKKTNTGFQVLTRDQDAALANIAKFLGMFKERVEVVNKNVFPTLSISAITNDPVEASKIYQKLMNET